MPPVDANLFDVPGGFVKSFTPSTKHSYLKNRKSLILLVPGPDSNSTLVVLILKAFMGAPSKFTHIITHKKTV